MTRPSLNGGKTRPLTAHALAELRSLLAGPRPTQAFNPGVVDRLTREDLATIGRMPSPYKTRRGTVPALEITDAGRRALQGDQT